MLYYKSWNTSNKHLGKTGFYINDKINGAMAMSNFFIFWGGGFTRPTATPTTKNGFQILIASRILDKQPTKFWLDLPLMILFRIKLWRKTQTSLTSLFCMYLSWKWRGGKRMSWYSDTTSCMYDFVDIRRPEELCA